MGDGGIRNGNGRTNVRRWERKKNWKRVVGGSSSKGRNAMRGEVRRRVERPELGEGEGEGEGEGGEGRRGEPRRTEAKRDAIAATGERRSRFVVDLVRTTLT